MNLIVILDWLNVTIQIILFILFAGALLEDKYGKYITLSAYFFVYVISYVATLFVKYNLYVKTPVMLAVDVLFVLFLFKNKLSYKIFIIVIKYLIIIVSEVLSIYLFNLICNGNNGLTVQQNSPERAVSVGFFNLMFLTIATIFIIMMQKVKFKITGTNVVLFIIFPLNQMILLVGVFYNDVNHLSNDVILFGTIGILVSILANVVLFQVLNKIAENNEIQEKLLIVDNMRDMETRYYDLIQHHVKEINLIRHDFNDQLITAYAVIEKYEGEDKILAKEILDAMNNNIEKLKMPILCENRTINTIVNVKKEQAEKLGIVFETQLDVPDNINIDKIDLCSIYSNLLNNAIEACQHITDKKIKKIIYVKTALKAEYLIVKVQNPKNGNLNIENGNIKTNKKNTMNHGFGLELLQRISERYNGQLDFQFDEKTFTATMVIEVKIANITVQGEKILQKMTL